MLYDHNEIKPEIKNRNITGKPINTWKLHNLCMKNHESNEVSKYVNKTMTKQNL